MSTPIVRVLVADDEKLIRDALVMLLDREPDIEVVATAADGHHAVERALAHRPDVAVVDLRMPGLDGIGVAVELGRSLPGCRCVILTGHGRPAVLRGAGLRCARLPRQGGAGIGVVGGGATGP